MATIIVSEVQRVVFFTIRCGRTQIIKEHYILGVEMPHMNIEILFLYRMT